MLLKVAKLYSDDMTNPYISWKILLDKGEMVCAILEILKYEVWKFK